MSRRLDMMQTGAAVFRVSVSVLLTVVPFIAPSCVQHSQSQELAALRARAEALLQVLRDGRWNEAAEFVSTDKITHQQIGIPDGASPEARRAKIARWFERIYGSVKPGSVHSVRIDPRDPSLALVSYRAGDLDAFNMRLADGEWLYTLDWEPHPKE